MYTLLLLLVPPLIGLSIILLVAIWGTNVLVERSVGRKHRLLEEMMNTGKLPVAWSSHLDLKGQSAKTQRKIAGQLDELIRYAQTTPLVADEESRQVLLERLDGIRADWAQ
ncbi:MAG: hypothetical protein AAF702_07585 [Chloroflexota bacterium]